MLPEPRGRRRASFAQNLLTATQQWISSQHLERVCASVVISMRMQCNLVRHPPKTSESDSEGGRDVHWPVDIEGAARVEVKSRQIPRWCGIARPMGSEPMSPGRPGHLDCFPLQSTISPVPVFRHSRHHLGQDAHTACCPPGTACIGGE